MVLRCFLSGCYEGYLLSCGVSRRGVAYIVMDCLHLHGVKTSFPVKGHGISSVEPLVSPATAAVSNVD
jgi:hypothetical protein